MLHLKFFIDLKILVKGKSWKGKNIIFSYKPWWLFIYYNRKIKELEDRCFYLFIQVWFSLHYGNNIIQTRIEKRSDFEVIASGIKSDYIITIMILSYLTELLMKKKNLRRVWKSKTIFLQSSYYWIITIYCMDTYSLFLVDLLKRMRHWSKNLNSIQHNYIVMNVFTINHYSTTSHI